jgi:hypothetical protein
MQLPFLCSSSLTQLTAPSSQEQNLAGKYFFNRFDGKSDTYDNFYTLRVLGVTVIWLLQTSLYNETNYRVAQKSVYPKEN